MELLTGLYLYVGYLLSDLLTDPSLPLFVGLHHGPTPLPITPRSVFFMLPDHEIFVNWTGFLTVPYRKNLVTYLRANVKFAVMV